MSGAVCTPIKTFLAGNAEESVPARLLQDSHQIWGVLQSVEPVGDGLVKAVFGYRPVLLPDELSNKLHGMIGQQAVAVRIGLNFRCGRLQQ